MLGGQNMCLCTVITPVKSVTNGWKCRWCYNLIYQVQCWGAKSLADDLATGQSVVFSRAASTLRSVETQLSIG